MDTTQKFFNAWLDTQNQFVDNLMDSSKKVQDSFQKGGLATDSADIYSEWVNKQANLMNTMISSITEEKKENMAMDMLQQWMDAQKKFGEAWVQFIKDNVPPQQEAMFQDYLKGNLDNVYSSWSQAYQQVTEQLTTPFKQYTPGDLGKNTFVELMNNTKTYMKMFEIWQPLFKTMSPSTVDTNQWKTFFDTSKYQEVMDNIMKSMNIPNTQELTENMKNYQKLFTDYMGMTKENFYGQWERMQEMLPTPLVTGNLEDVSKMVSTSFEQYQKFMKPYLTTLPEETSDMMVIMQENQELYIKYYIKAMELQNMVTVTGQEAMEKVVKDLMAKMQETSEFVSFDEFFNSWVNVVEDDMVSLFGGDTYSKLQADLVTISMTMKKNLDGQIESALAPLSIAPRSEIDELNKTIHDLKAQVRKLEKKVADNAKKPTTTRRKTVAKKTTATNA